MDYECPVCNGMGYVVREYNAGAGVPKSIDREYCDTCSGTGKVDPVRRQRILRARMLIKHRVKKGLTRDQAADKLGVIITFYIDAERGVTAYPVEWLKRL